MPTEYAATIPFSIQGQALAAGDRTTLEDQAAKWHLLDDRIIPFQAGGTVGSIVGIAFSDDDSSGSKDSDEDGVAGVELLVTDSASTAYTVFTDADGGWSIANLPVGSVTVAIVSVPAPYTVVDQGANYPFSSTIVDGQQLVAPPLDLIPQF